MLEFYSGGNNVVNSKRAVDECMEDALGSFQFLGHRQIERGAVAVALADPTIKAVQHGGHGYTILGEPFVVTRSVSNRVYEIDGEAAWSALTRRAGVPETNRGIPRRVQHPRQAAIQQGAQRGVSGSNTVPAVRRRQRALAWFLRCPFSYRIESMEYCAR